MRKKDFLKRLNRGLVDCSRSERRDILNYYDELIEDIKESTGKSEARVIEDLGSIKEICKRANPRDEDDKIHYEEPTKRNHKRKKNGLCGIILLILLFPFWFSLIMMLASIIISVVASALGIGAGGVVMMVNSFSYFTESLTYALFRLGIGILAIGLTILIAPLILKLVVALTKALGSFIKWLFIGGRGYCDED